MILGLEQQPAAGEGDGILHIINWFWVLIEDDRWLIFVALWFVSYLCRRTERVQNRDIPFFIVGFSFVFSAFAFWPSWKFAPLAIVYAGLALMFESLFLLVMARRLGVTPDELAHGATQTKVQTTVEVTSPQTVNPQDKQI